MRRWIGLFAAVSVLTLSLVGGASALADEVLAVIGEVEPDLAAIERDRRGSRNYDVTITNLTRDQQFTPILVASHRSGGPLFGLGEAASSELEALAEFGDTGPLAAQLMTSARVRDVNASGGLLGPGESVTVTVRGGARFSHFSIGAMLIPTNDAFVALNGVAGPGNRGSVSYYAVAYDSGTEINDELCASIPGPDFAECGGPGTGGSPEGGEEGFVHVHSGIHGIGDLDAARRDWRNPVAAVRITAVARQDDGDDDGDDDD